MKRKRQVMQPNVFEAVLDKYIIPLKNDEEKLGYPPTIIFTKDGEGLINPNLREYMLKIAMNHPEFRFNLYTNGLLLTEDFLDFVNVLPNKTWLFISYHFFNYDGSKNDYSKLDELMLKVLNSKEKKYKQIEFVFTSHVTRFITKDDLNMWGQIWKSKVPEGKLVVGINDCINPWTGLIDEPNCVKFSGCPYADFGHIFIGVTGNVIPCCMTLEEDIIFGNVLEDDPKEMQKKLEDFYVPLREMKFNEIICQKCQGIYGVANE